ncbi:hypothetical protein ZHAS_00021452 [Anopheles sinensis]|uniref:Uncharacterized protein n=1 Tax=Anopheles sinensis TaxID=74873 RepID=A0A084WSF9_ANOSI|nr:hypothetical protein ZHAS_00021452 [Anopheles sinensis]
MGSWSRRTCSSHFTLLMVLVLLAGVLVTGSRVRSAVAARWQSRISPDGALNAIHESAVKPAPFSKSAVHVGGSMKRSYYVPTVANPETKLHHFINNLKTGIGASKLAHAVNGVTGALQQSVAGLLSTQGHTNSVFRAPASTGYYGTGNELRYGQPFVSKQPSTAGHFKSQGYGPKGGKLRRHPPAKAGKYDALMSDLGISGYKHFENAVIRDLERREELKVEATIHTLSAVAARWQSRISPDGALNAIHESAVKPAPFSKSAVHVGGSMKRSYYVPTVANPETKLHHFINNLKTGIGASKLAHAVNGVTGALQQSVAGLLSTQGHTNSAYRAPANTGYYGTGNELRYGQPFASKQPSTAGHFKSQGYGPKGGKLRRHPPAKAGKYDALMSDLGISGYKHFENAVIRDLERREELKVEATIHTLFPEASDDDWRPIPSNKKPGGLVPNKQPVGTRNPTGPEFSETKVVHTLKETPSAKRPTVEKSVGRPVKQKSASTGHATVGSVSTKSTVAPAQKHRVKGSPVVKDKRTKERTKCWNCFNTTTTPVTTKQQPSYSTTARVPTTVSNQQQPPQRFGPTYDTTMFYGSNGKPPATLVGAVAKSYSNVEVHYNRTVSPPPPFIPGPWSPQGPLEVSTQSQAPPVALTEAPGTGALYTTTKKSFSKLVKPYVGSLAPVADGEAVTSTTTHKPTGGSQGTKGTKGPGSKKQRTAHKADAHRRPVHGNPLDSFGAGSGTNELRVRKKFDPKYSRNRGTIKFKDALQKNPDQIYR